MKITSSMSSTQSIETHSTAKQRTQADQAQSVSSAYLAYQVDISSAGEKLQATERIMSLFEQLKIQGNDARTKLTAAPETDMDEFMAGVMDNRQKSISVSEEYKGIIVDCEPNDPMESFLGEGGLWADLVGERELEATGMVNPLREQSQAVMNKYFNADSAIEQGGAGTFRKLNLEFAGTAYAANRKDGDLLADKDIAKGFYTREEYNRAQSFALKLQNKAGVFVQASSGDGTFSYEYNGTIAKVGVKCLNLMASHEEAEDVWINAVQGKYKNNGEVAAALKEGGFSEAAKGYEELLRSQVTKYWTMDSLMQSEFVQENGQLWNAAVGKDKFAEFQAQYGGNGHFTYTAKQLTQAYQDGQQEAEIIHKATSDRDPSDLYVTNDGRVIQQKQEDKNKQSNSSEEQINALQEKIKRIQQQLSELHKNFNLSPEEATRQTETYQKQIETYQRQIMDIKIQELERQKDHS